MASTANLEVQQPADVVKPSVLKHARHDRVRIAIEIKRIDIEAPKTWNNALGHPTHDRI